MNSKDIYDHVLAEVQGDPDRVLICEEYWAVVLKVKAAPELKSFDTLDIGDVVVVDAARVFAVVSQANREEIELRPMFVVGDTMRGETYRVYSCDDPPTLSWRLKKTSRVDMLAAAKYIRLRCKIHGQIILPTSWYTGAEFADARGWTQEVTKDRLPNAKG